MKNSKKWLLSLGSAAAIAAPIAAVVACGSKSDPKADAEKLINDYVADSSNHATLTPKDTAKKPSQIQTSDIEISDLISKYNDIQLSIKSITNRDDTAGKVTAEVEVSSGSQTTAAKQTYTVDVTGFNIDQKAVAEKLINDYVADSSNHATLTPTDVAKSKLPNAIQTSDIKISNLIDKYNDIQLSIKSIKNHDDSTGKVIAEVEVSSKTQKEAAKKTYDVEVTGFTSKAAALKSKLDSINIISNGITINNTSGLAAVTNGQTLDQTAATKLGITLSNTPQGLTGVTYTYTHSGITADGDLTVTIKATKDGVTSDSKKVQVHVTGIDKAKAEKLISDYVADSNTKAQPSITDAGQKLPSTVTANDFTIKQPKDNNADLELEITSVKPDNTAGKVTVTVTVSSKSQKNATTKTYTVKVDGFMTQSQKDANKALINVNQVIQNYSANTPPTIKTNSKTITPDQVKKDDFNITQPANSDLKLEVTGVKQISNANDNTTKVIATVTVSSKSQSNATTKTYDVEVDGFTSKAAALKSKLDSINIISNGITINNTSGLAAVTNGQTLDQTAASKLGITLPTNTQGLKGVTYTYTHSGITADGYLTVTIKATKDNVILDFKKVQVHVTGIDAAKETQLKTDLKTSLDAIDDVSNLSVTKISFAKINETKLTSANWNDKLKELGITLTKDLNAKLTKLTTNGVDLYYSTNKALNQDGDVIVTIKAKNGNTKLASKTVTVTVFGIDEAKAEKLKADLKTSLNLIANASLKTQNTTSFAIISEKEVSQTDLIAKKIKELNIALSEELVNKLSNGVKLTYSTDKALNADGSLTVTIKAKNGNTELASKTVTVTVSGIDEAKAEKLKADLKTSLNLIANASLKTQNTTSFAIISEKEVSQTDLIAKKIKELNIALSEELVNKLSNGVKLTYSTDKALNADGSLTVTIKAKNGNTELASKTVTVTVSGIDEAKAKQAATGATSNSQTGKSN